MTSSWQLENPPDIETLLAFLPTLTPHGHMLRVYEEPVAPHQPGSSSIFPGCLSSLTHPRSGLDA